ncbi:hypothetical protein VNO77_32225 [Canavalia gladiata]|uniref:Exocyst subunit Exo70 family protein n=1 Tax=Canavalia gladiata TaxID=3824 RepID=A0AAN9KPN2_CANGL
MKSLSLQIPRWMMQQEAWRFAGFASTVVELVCYALSSSFNFLFGEWNVLKIFLYSVFSFFICYMILFAKECKLSRRPRVKAHSAFLILTITSVYSFFFDKVVNGKPDAYSLISCAAFAIMSLSLSISRQSQCEFQVDLLYFFLGCLIVQLMKIKLLLAIIGACFSYALVILRISLNATTHDEYLEIQDKHSVIIEVDSQQLASTNLSTTMQRLMTCMRTLEEAYSNLTDKLLEDNSEFAVTESDLNLVMEAIPSETINDLRETATFMANFGFGKECADVFITCRRKRLEECLISEVFGLEEINMEEKHVEDSMIGRWTKAFKIAIRILFPCERQLCYRVFSASDNCFAEICGGTAIQLLNFADKVASGGTSKWRLWQILDMFETLRDLIPEFESLFPVSLVNEAIETKNRLGEASRDIFMKLGSVIFGAPKLRVPPPSNGGLHPVTGFVRGYLVSSYRSRRILEHILQEYPKVVKGRRTCFSFSEQMESVMELLERRLAAQSKNYISLSLRYFYMMNNRRYIEDMEKEQEQETISSDGWFRKTRDRVQQNLELYRRNSWDLVLDLLKLDSNELVVSNVAADSMKDKLNLFNRQFKEMCSIQSKWFLSDKQLREQIIMSLENILLPAYGNFIGRFHDVLGGHAYEYIKFGIFDIQDGLNHLFFGSMWKSKKP